MTMIARRPASWTSPFAITIQERPSSVISGSAYRRGLVPARRIKAATLLGDRLAMMSGSHSGVTTLDLRLAPMAAVTNAPFRLVARECGAGLLTSEEIDARAPSGSGGVAPTTVTPRTRSRPFSGLAPWAIIGAVVDAVRIPVTGNGDVRSHDDARAMIRATGCAAVMIGRGALGAPWIFTGRAVSRAEQAQIIRRHSALIEAHLDPRTALVQLKKHLAWYANGLPFAARIRAELFAAPSAAAVSDAFWRLW